MEEQALEEDEDGLSWAAGDLGAFDHLVGHHCMRKLRTLPRVVREKAISQFMEVKTCEMESESRARTRGVLMVRGAFDDDVSEEARSH